MKTPVFNSYRIQIDDSRVRCISANRESGKGFLFPDISDNLPKLYVIKNGPQIHYVGLTIQDIRKRLRQGFTAKGEHGYYGYKWKGQETAEMLIWCFPHSTKEQVEAIEAELVYYVRKTTGNWPLFQMEIHFHGASEEERRIAKVILGQCLK